MSYGQARDSAISKNFARKIYETLGFALLNGYCSTYTDVQMWRTIYTEQMITINQSRRASLASATQQWIGPHLFIFINIYMYK